MLFFLFSIEKKIEHLKKNLEKRNPVLLCCFAICPTNVPIICFKIKNPPTLHSTSKIQPTTSPTFVFSVFGSVRKTWGYEIKLLSRFGRSSSCFLNSSKHLMSARFNLAVKKLLVYRGIFIN
jgi:hypothetical protein